MAIFKSESGYVISSDETYLPGVYDSERAAKYAFRFPNKVLSELQKSINPDGVITFAMLQEERKKLKQQVKK